METSGMKSILVIDDDKMSLNMAQKALRDIYSLTLVKSGQQGLAYLLSHTCDLILLDYEMPIMSGVQVLEQLRNNPKTCDIPVIFLTGNNSSHDIKTALSLKPDGYMLKPFKAKDLRQRIEEVFEMVERREKEWFGEDED